MITVIAVGKLKDPSLKKLIHTYEKRLNTSITWLEVPQGSGKNPETIKKQEWQTIETYLKKISESACIVALDEKGKNLTSAAFAQVVDNCWQNSQKLVFVIGGAEGLSPHLWARANDKLSLGSMTWPHMFVRLLLVEQLYRAQQINIGHPYHRD